MAPSPGSNGRAVGRGCQASWFQHAWPVSAHRAAGGFSDVLAPPRPKGGRRPRELSLRRHDDALGRRPRGLPGPGRARSTSTPRPRRCTPRPVREAVTAFYRELEEGGDRHWDAWIEKREAVRRKVARFVGAEPDEIAFVPNTSTGINLIADLLEGDGPVLSDELEFPTVTLPWIHRGVLVRFVAGGRGRPAPRVVRGGRGAARGHDRDQPRAVLERLPPGPRRVRPPQGPAPPGGVRQPVGRAPSRWT